MSASFRNYCNLASQKFILQIPIKHLLDDASISTIPTTAITSLTNCTKYFEAEIRNQQINESMQTKRQNILPSSLLKQAIINRMHIDTAQKQCNITSLYRNTTPQCATARWNAKTTDKNGRNNRIASRIANQRDNLAEYMTKSTKGGKSKTMKKFAGISIGNNVENSEIRKGNDVILSNARSLGITVTTRWIPTFLSKKPLIESTLVHEDDIMDNKAANHIFESVVHHGKSDSTLSESNSRNSNKSVTFANHVTVIEIEGRTNCTDFRRLANSKDDDKHEEWNDEEGKSVVSNNQNVCNMDSKYFEAQESEMYKTEGKDRCYKETYEINQPLVISSSEDDQVVNSISFLENLGYYILDDIVKDSDESFVKDFGNHSDDNYVDFIREDLNESGTNLDKHEVTFYYNDVNFTSDSKEKNVEHQLEENNYESLANDAENFQHSLTPNNCLPNSNPLIILNSAEELKHRLLEIPFETSNLDVEQHPTDSAPSVSLQNLESIVSQGICHSE